MKRSSVNDRGFTHILVLGVAVVVILSVGIVFTLVNRADRHTIQANAQAANSSAKAASKINDTSSAKSTASPASTSPNASSTLPSSTSSTKAPAVASKSSSSTPHGSSSSSTPTSNSSGSASTPAPAPTPQSVLTSIVISLSDGGSANVTTSDVAVPAAVFGSVEARPIVFSANNITYFAYTRVNPPNFNTSTDATVSSFVITPASGTYTLVQAHVNKSGYLNGPNMENVGYTPSSS